MARRKGSNKTSSKNRRSASQIALYVISLIIVLTMAIGFVLSMLPTPAGRSIVVTPTPIIVVTPTSTSTAEPSATPTESTETPPAEGTTTPQAGQ
jgi:hypothetical protein